MNRTRKSIVESLVREIIFAITESSGSLSGFGPGVGTVDDQTENVSLSSTFHSLVGKPVKFYGVDSTYFCLGANGKKIVFEAVADMSDGYRSFLDAIDVSNDKDKKIFFSKPLATVMIEPSDEEVSLKDGYKFIDVETGHEWLRIGTNVNDDYYPVFIFEYSPDRTQGFDVR